MITLLSCPFCDSEPRVIRVMGEWHPEGYAPVVGVRLVCTNEKCSGMSSVFETEEEAAEQWNTRADTAPVNPKRREYTSRRHYRTKRRNVESRVNRLNKKVDLLVSRVFKLEVQLALDPVDIIEASTTSFFSKLKESPQVLQYYYAMDDCNGDNKDDPKCICWHDQGTGPFSEARRGADVDLLWRAASEDMSSKLRKV